jgi:glycosyltransferase involved in cell wall biosynthesis
MKDKKKILVLIDWFAPGFRAGGPVQSCLNFAHLMKGQYDVFILTTDTDLGATSPYPNILTGQWLNNLSNEFSVLYIPKNELSKRSIRTHIDEVQPDFLYLNSMYSPYFVLYPVLLKKRKRIQSKIVLFPRGALYASALAIKRLKKIPFLFMFRRLGWDRSVRFQASDERERQAIKDHFPAADVMIVPDSPLSVQEPLQKLDKQIGALKLLFVARIVPIKNLAFLLEALALVKQNVQLTIVGPVEDPEYWEQCKSKISLLPSNISVQVEGPKQNDLIHLYLKEHHLYTLPSAGESFGHSIFEALLAGRPVLVSDQTPWKDLASKSAGWDLPLNDKVGFAAAISTAANWDNKTFQQWSEATWNYAADFLANSTIRNAYEELFS